MIDLSQKIVTMAASRQKKTGITRTKRVRDTPRRKALMARKTRNGFTHKDGLDDEILGQIILSKQKGRTTKRIRDTPEKKSIPPRKTRNSTAHKGRNNDILTQTILSKLQRHTIHKTGSDGMLNQIVLPIQKVSTAQHTNNFKTAKTRRQRGYQWESVIVNRFKKTSNWKAFRLGSPSISLPDVLAVNTKNSTIFSIEAKSGTGTTLSVPADQIQRCLDWIEIFDIYKNKSVLLAFKFSSKKRVSTGQYERRELREYYKVWDESVKVCDCVCTYDGNFFLKTGKRQKEALNLEECVMPFKTKQRFLVPKTT